MAHDDNDPLMTTSQAADYLGIAASTLERYRLTGQPAIAHVKFGGPRGPVRYRKSVLDQFIADSMRLTTSDRGAT